MAHIRKGTLSVWGGEMDQFSEGATTPPIYHSVTFAYDDLDHWHEVALGNKRGHIYSRNTNPTVSVLEEKIQLLESGESAIAFSSGMGAISNTLFTFLQAGSKVISIKDSYGGTSKLFMDILPGYKVSVELLDTTDHDQLEYEISRGCDLVYLETPTNPTLKILDIKRLSQAARKVGAIVVVDNTFATPINQNPLSLGADLVIHSATKYLSGHSDVIGGLLVGRKSLVDSVFAFREVNGANMHAQAAYMILRGMKTLELRLERQNLTAMKIAHFLDDHPRILQVFYPGLHSHPGHGIAKEQMSGFGGMLSFVLDSDYRSVRRFLEKLQWVHLAASLGSVSTLAGTPRTTSHVELTGEQRETLGIPESLIRYSVGIENPEDLLEDLEQALKTC